jgi:hypothetical protein
MQLRGLRILLAAFLLALNGCAGSESIPPLPHLEIPVYYYVGALELNLKATPDAAGANGARVQLNERVQSLKRQGAWFLVRTAGGQEGWANDRDLSLEPVNQLYVRRWGVHLRQTPGDRAATVERLRINDQVKILEQNPHGWTQVTVARTGNTGWLKSPDLSLDRVSVPPPVKRRNPPAPAPAALPLLTPTPAEAAPPPPEAAPPPPQAPTPGPRPAPGKARPEMFEPF